MPSPRKNRFLPQRLILRGLLFTCLLVLPAACFGPAPLGSPSSQVLGPRTTEVSAFSTLTLLAKDDPTQAHWVDFFAASVDLDGDVLVSGAPRWGRPPGEAPGAAYVYRRASTGDWRVEATLIPGDKDDGFQYDQFFGAAVAVNGTTIAVGAPGSDDLQAGDNSGAVYVFDYRAGAWVQTAKLIPRDPILGARFGANLAFDGDLLAASGAPGAGGVWIFQRDSGAWRQTARLPVPASPDGEPYSVLLDLYGDTLAVSTISQQLSQNTGNEQLMIQSLRCSGAVTLYQRSGDDWKQVFQTAPQDAALQGKGENGFGLPVSIGGAAGRATLLAVGKPGFSKSGLEVGAVAIYERGDLGWAPQAELSLAPGEQAPGSLATFFPEPGRTFFGAFVNFEGERLAVVSSFANTVYVFDHQGAGWTYRFRITPGASYGDDFMRRVVGLSGSRLVLGSPGELGGGYAFVFDLPQ